MTNDSDIVVSVNSMNFEYPASPPLISDFTLNLRGGCRCLLIGANGAGKSTLLRILAGKHMVGGIDVVKILGRSAFHDTALTCDSTLCYLGGSWTRNIGCAGEVPLQADFSAEHMIFGVGNVDPDRRSKLIDFLDIDLEWRMNKVSDGQRRRVQICMALLRPFQVLLLDEVTVDLDVVARSDLLNFFIQECEERGATIIYATHILDGLESWATDIAYVKKGELKRSEKLEKTLIELAPKSKRLVHIVESWLREERSEDELKQGAKTVSKKSSQNTSAQSPWASSRHMAYYR